MKKKTKDSKEEEAFNGPHDGSCENPYLFPMLDRGWSWVVLFGSFMLQGIIHGVAYSFGIYIDQLIEAFDCSRAEIGLLGSLILGVMWGAGPIASIFVNKLGCRLVTVIGSLIAASGFFITTWAPNTLFMFFSLGIVAGFGLNLVYFTSVVVVSFYFDKRRSLAISITVCGAGVGTFVFAPLTELLLENYNWRGTVLIHAGLLLNCILFGMLHRPLNEQPHSRATEKENVIAVSVTSATEADDSDASMAKNQCTSSRTSRVSATSTCDEIISSEECGQLGTQMESSTIAAAVTVQPSPLLNCLSAVTGFEPSETLNKAAIIEIDHNQCDENVVRMHSNESTTPLVGTGSKVVHLLVKFIDLKLLIDVIFILFALSNIFANLSFASAHIFLYDRGLQKGLSNMEAAILVSVISISITFGKIVYGVIADCKCVDKLMLHNTVLVFGGIVAMFSFVCSSFVTHIIYTSLLGIFVTVNTALTLVILVDLYGLDKITNVFGYVSFFQGFGTIAGSPIVGLVYDATNNYDFSFMLIGASMVVGGLVSYPIRCIQKQRTRSKRLTG